MLCLKNWKEHFMIHLQKKIITRSLKKCHTFKSKVDGAMIEIIEYFLKRKKMLDFLQNKKVILSKSWSLYQDWWENFGNLFDKNREIKCWSKNKTNFPKICDAWKKCLENSKKSSTSNCWQLCAGWIITEFSNQLFIHCSALDESFSCTTQTVFQESFVKTVSYLWHFHLEFNGVVDFLSLHFQPVLTRYFYETWYSASFVFNGV